MTQQGTQCSRIRINDGISLLETILIWTETANIYEKPTQNKSHSEAS